jgi:starch synthase
MKYGAIPIVPNVGCFGDDIETDEDKENGFLYNHYDWKSLKEAVSKALQSYQNPKSWGKLIQRAMKYDTTWNKVARSYQEIYDSIE